jgi:hypothetical protein
MLQKGSTFNHVVLNNVARIPKKFEFKIRKNENSLPTACTCCWQRSIFANSPTRLLGKKALCQQRGSPVGEGLFPLPTTNGEVDGVGTVWPRRGFANSFSFPTGTVLGKNSFANSRTLPSVFGFWAVGEDFFPDSGVFLLGKSFFANSSGLGCWESSGLLAKPQFTVVDVLACGLSRPNPRTTASVRSFPSDQLQFCPKPCA